MGGADKSDPKAEKTTLMGIVTRKTQFSNYIITKNQFFEINMISLPIDAN